MEAIDIVNSDLELLSDWYKQNKLSLNINKTKAILFSERESLSLTDSCHFKINITKIEEVDQFKILGVYFDRKLNWNWQITFNQLFTPILPKEAWL